MSKKNILIAIVATYLLSGCGSMIGSMVDPKVKVSSPFVTKVIEGEVAKVDKKDNPRLKKPEITTTDAVITHAQANNINSPSTTRKLLALDIALDVLSYEPEKVEFYTITDNKTGESVDILRSSIYPLGKPGASVGDKIRLIYGDAGLLAVYNLTTNPGLDERTR
ncbi:hypothetical protein [Diaphorobacter sp. J5-51]|uniref:hypothetical protein n=1 Tax=Diaphorobacter sp. J5-51 TaxID=680496 RepID=UPI0012FAA8C1|nr:hypothetical protein [Diaphorobacter sp. J5-51]